MALVKEPEYRNWLAANTKLADRAISDTVSRTRRVAGMIDLAAAKSTQDVYVMLIRSDKFEACTPSVRSQLKKAASMYVQFRKAGAGA